MSEHEHVFEFMGLVYSYENYPRAGTGARDRYYEDKFFCRSCLEIRYANKRYDGNSYWPALLNSSPKRSTS